MKRAYLETYGCQMNVADSALMTNVLESAGFAMTDDVADASLVLINTCAIREKAEERVQFRLTQLGYLKRVRPDLVIGVTGCMPKHLGKALMDRLPQIDLFIGPDSYRNLPSLVEEAQQKPTLALGLDGENYADLDPVSIEGIHAFVPIMRGCDRFCTFCVVPYTRGREKSLPLEDVIRQVKTAVDQGVVAITLLGQTVNSYKHEGRSFVDLLDAVSRVEGVLRVRFTSPHPVHFEEATFALIAERDNLCPHIHLPVQSGSNRLLESMKRGHSREEFLDLVEMVRTHLPDAGLTTDIIVGYPGETEEDFEETFTLSSTARFDSAFMFRYSPRSGTFAYRKLRDQEIDDEVSGERLKRLVALQESISLERYQRWVGRDISVLVEGPSRRNPEHCMGKSDDGKTVILPGGEAAGSLCTVKIARATSHTLIAEGVSDSRRPEASEGAEPVPASIEV